jgi:hypothetical protein
MHSQFPVAAAAADDWVPHTITYSIVSQTVVCVPILICQPVALIIIKKKIIKKMPHIFANMQHCWQNIIYPCCQPFFPISAFLFQ